MPAQTGLESAVSDLDSRIVHIRTGELYGAIEFDHFFSVRNYLRVQINTALVEMVVTSTVSQGVHSTGQGSGGHTHNSPASSQLPTNPKKISMYPKQQAAMTSSLSYEQTGSGVSSPYSGAVGSVPVILQPPSTSVSPNYYAVPPTQYILDTSSYSPVGQYVAVPAAMLSPTVVGPNPQFTTYASYGFAPATGFTSGNSSPRTKHTQHLSLIHI